jgi:hypothetical protein
MGKRKRNATPHPPRPAPSGNLAAAAREGHLNRTNALWVAVVGAVAVVAAALLAWHPWSSGGAPQLGISGVSYPLVHGHRVIEVTGTVTDLGAGQFIYAFAAQQPDTAPWYAGGPAAISGGGVWTVEITNLPASAANMSVWAGTVAPPQPGSGTGGTGGPAVSRRVLRQELAQLRARGPHAPELTGVTPARHVALPPD